MTKLARVYLFAFLLISGWTAVGCSQNQPPAATSTTTTTTTTTTASTSPAATTAASPAGTTAASPAATTAASPASTTAAASPAGDATPGDDNGAADDETILAGGKKMTHPVAEIEFVLPKGWTQEQKGDRLTATAPDGNVFMVFVVTEAKEVGAVAEAMGTIVDETLNDVKVTTEAKTEEINGLTQVWADGNGTLDGKNVNWDASIVVGGKKALAVLAMGEIEKNQDTVYAVYRSIKSSGGGGDADKEGDKGGDEKEGDKE